MATLSIQLSGSAVVNGGKDYTLTDPVVQRLINYLKIKFETGLPANPTNGQVLTKWVQNWIDTTKAEVQIFETPAPVRPTQVDIT